MMEDTVIEGSHAVERHPETVRDPLGSCHSDAHTREGAGPTADHDLVEFRRGDAQGPEEVLDARQKP